MRHCDFIPADYRERRSLRRSIRRRASMIATLIGMMAIWVGAHHRQLASAKAMLCDLERQSEQVRLHLAEKAVLEAERKQLEARANLVSCLASPTSLSVVLSDLSRRLGDTGVVTEIHVRSMGLARFATLPAVTQQTGPPKTKTERGVEVSAAVPSDSAGPALTLKGVARTAQDVINFAAALEGSPLFDRVQIQSQGVMKWAGHRGEKFQIDCDLIQQTGEVR